MTFITTHTDSTARSTSLLAGGLHSFDRRGVELNKGGVAMWGVPSREFTDVQNQKAS
jgi:hypothetical protein